jgi:5,10-methylene-tetrahydrofolate dehydrogenase/methenyl tetrahydrofolate cyclohydrolase
MQPDSRQTVAVDGLNLANQVRAELAQAVAAIVAPHRRGVGPMTITMPLHDTLLACEARACS